MNFRAFLVLAKTAGSARTNESMSFIWIVWSTLYLYLWSKVKFISLNIISYTYVNPIRGATFTTNAFIFNFNHFFLSFFSRKQSTQFLMAYHSFNLQNILWLWCDIVTKIVQLLKTQIETQQPKGLSFHLWPKVWPIIETMEFYKKKVVW